LALALEVVAWPVRHDFHGTLFGVLREIAEHEWHVSFAPVNHVCDGPLELAERDDWRFDYRSQQLVLIQFAKFYDPRHVVAPASHRPALPRLILFEGALLAFPCYGITSEYAKSPV
jgi:hypothetical protein